MSDDDEIAVGIDLGTTNSVLAYLDPHGRPMSIANSEGDLLTPSVIYFEPQADPIVGKEAVKAGTLDPEHTVEAVKRDMGRDIYPRAIRGKYYSPAALSGIILKRLVEDARARAGNVTRAVITVPAYFNEPRRKATVDAAMHAGLTEVELINEPTSAALSFGFQLGVFNETGIFAPTNTKVPGQFTFLVYDLGGGTFDVTLLTIKDQTFTALVCDGDVQLGGRDWDERVLHYACDAFLKETGLDPRQSAESLSQFRAECESAKKTLTQRTQATLRLMHEGQRFSLELSRQQFVQLTADLLGRTRLTCELALREAKMKWSDLDAILLVGGSSRMPMVFEMLSEMSGIEPNRSVSPDEAVAHGAALYAQLIWGDRPQTRLTEKVRKRFELAKVRDINSHSLGIVGVDQKTGKRKVAAIIAKHTPIPHSNTRVFRIRRFGQEEIHIQIVEGESEDPAHCAIIGECRLKQLPPELPVGWPVAVTFAYRRDGRIFVEAWVKGAKPFQVEIDRKRSLSAKDAEAWASDLIGEDDDEDGSPKPKADQRKRKPELPPSLIKEGKVAMERYRDKARINPPKPNGSDDES